LSGRELRAALIGKRLTTVGGPKKGTRDQGDEAFRADETWMQDPTWAASGEIPAYAGRNGSVKLWFEQNSYCVLIFGAEGRCSRIWKDKDGRFFLKHYYYKREGDERREITSTVVHEVKIVSVNYHDAIAKKKGTQ
jgi:hypothetical protein